MKDLLPPDPPHERLDAWRASHELALVVYRATRTWSPSAAGTLAERVRDGASRAGVSLLQFPTRGTVVERLRCAEVALGALAQVSYLLLLARDLGVIDREEWQLLDGFATRAGQLTGGLVRALGRPASGGGVGVRGKKTKGR